MPASWSFRGFRRIRVEDPELIGDAWDKALSADRPVVIEVLTGHEERT